jgi:hypothetical protein
MGMMVTCGVRWITMVSCSVVVVIRRYLGDNRLTLRLLVGGACVVEVAATFYFGTCSHYYGNIFKIKLLLLDVYMGLFSEKNIEK